MLAQLSSESTTYYSKQWNGFQIFNFNAVWACYLVMGWLALKPSFVAILIEWNDIFLSTQWHLTNYITDSCHCALSKAKYHREYVVTMQERMNGYSQQRLNLFMSISNFVLHEWGEKRKYQNFRTLRVNCSIYGLILCNQLAGSDVHGRGR